MKSGDLTQNYIAQLSTIYNKGEAESITRIVMEDVAGLYNGNDDDLEISENLAQRLNEILARLMKYEPLQYVLGEQYFYGLKFKVNPAVLIPRSETEELVDWIIKENKQNEGLNILDIGTGSGCIAITIKKNIPSVQVFAIDLSGEALDVAKENADILKADVSFTSSDILNTENPFGNSFDIIVSNPPYVTKSETKVMLQNVTAYEPHLALFVPDNDALIFYKAIIQFANSNLKAGGRLYFEINEALGKEVESLLKENGYSDVVIKKDMQGKDRMVKALLSTPKGF